jgi:hypothetical protein
MQDAARLEAAMVRTTNLAGSFDDSAFTTAIIGEVKRRRHDAGMTPAQAWDSVGDDIATGKASPERMIRHAERPHQPTS